MYKTIDQVHNALKNKEISCVELTQRFLNWLKERQPDINAFITILENEALGQAKKVDEKIANGAKIGLLEGAPCAIKDNILIKDIKATAGSRILENGRPSQNRCRMCRVHPPNRCNLPGYHRLHV